MEGAETPELPAKEGRGRPGKMISPFRSTVTWKLLSASPHMVMTRVSPGPIT